ncbi:MFS general substrate transporter [Aspergillus neoniger CBS 115656]|uniref:MFS general substrate transporter n=1 Tax=Aspergillus neoniger (strain CBS 115656) TaxID=1448310 RepID=A0A318Z148_ASPNB|nr:MFS general substrate transporter [Aspergillus neoniger CBS 115656]PYH38663.1 MFS general substrate transporter [Aspergillus neoniger CBS 115656]
MLIHETQYDTVTGYFIQGAKAHNSSKVPTDDKKVITVGFYSKNGIRLLSGHVHEDGSYQLFESRAGKEMGRGQGVDEKSTAEESGICMGGSSAGGATIPVILRTLFSNYGWTWSIRVIAFIALGCYAAAIILVKGRLPAASNSKATIDFRAFGSPRLCFLTVAVFSLEFIIFGCAALLPTYVRFAGFPTDVQFYSLTVLNCFGLVGRVLPGFAADKIGRFNILLCLVLLTFIIMATVWLPVGSHDVRTLYTVVAIFGFGSGGWISLAPVCAGQLCRTEEYGRFYGTLYSVASFGVLLAVPVGGDLLQSTTSQILIGFYSAVLLVGLVGLILSRWALLDWKWRWKVKV